MERSTKGVYSGCEPKYCNERLMCVSAPTSSRNASDQGEASIHHEGNGDIKRKTTMSGHHAGPPPQLPKGDWTPSTLSLSPSLGGRSQFCSWLNMTFEGQLGCLIGCYYQLAAKIDSGGAGILFQGTRRPGSWPIEKIKWLVSNSQSGRRHDLAGFGMRQSQRATLWRVGEWRSSLGFEAALFGSIWSRGQESWLDAEMRYVRLDLKVGYIIIFIVIQIPSWLSSSSLIDNE